MNTIDILKQARAKITDPKHWTKGAMAHNANNKPARITGKSAVCWCAVGAIGTVRVNGVLPVQTMSDFGADHFKAVNALEKQLKADGFPDSVSTFNDTHTHQKVLGLFDVTIAGLERWKQHESL